MEDFYSGKIVWITGASSGIGEALVKALAKRGATIILSSRREEELKRVMNEAGLTEENGYVLPIDLNNADHIMPAYEVLKQKFGKIDILVCNAGVVQRFSVLDSTMKTNRHIMELNFFAAIALAKCVLPGMIERKAGNIIVISSVLGKISLPMRSMYAASKHALHGFFEALRGEVFRNNIKVALVTPGYIRTNISLNALDGKGNTYNKMDKGQANGMPAEECAEKILKAVEKGKEDIFVGRNEKYPMLLYRFFPRLFNYMIKRRNIGH